MPANFRARWFWLAGALINIALWVLALAVFPREDPAAILHYSGSQGIDIIGSGQEILNLPLLGLIILISHIFFGSAIKPADIKSAWIWWGSIPFLQLLLLSAFFTLWQVNQSL